MSRHRGRGACATGAASSRVPGGGRRNRPRADIPAGDSARILDACRFCTTWKTASRRSSGGGSSSTAAATRRWTRRARPAGWARRDGHRLSPHPGPRARAGIEVAEALEEGVPMRWLSTIQHADDGSLLSSGWRSTRPGSRSRPARSKSSRRTADPGAGPGYRPSLLDGVPGVTSRRRRRQVDPNDDRASGVFAGGDMVPGRTHGDRAVGHGKTGGARTSTRGCAAARAIAAAEHRPRPTSNGSTPGTTPTPRDGPAELEAARRLKASTKSSAGWMSPRRCSRRGDACRAETASSATTATAYVRTTQSSSWSPAGGTIRLRLLQGLRDLRSAECPCGAIVMRPSRRSVLVTAPEE